MINCSSEISGIFFVESSVLIKSSSLISSKFSISSFSFFPSSVNNLFINSSDGLPLLLEPQFVSDNDPLISSIELELIFDEGIFIKFSLEKFSIFFISSSFVLDL